MLIHKGKKTSFYYFSFCKRGSFFFVFLEYNISYTIENLFYVKSILVILSRDGIAGQPSPFKLGPILAFQKQDEAGRANLRLRAQTTPWSIKSQIVGLVG